MPEPRGKLNERFSPSRVSASRVNSYLNCGIAFRRRYIEGEPAEIVGSAALFGNVIHDALEKWSLNREQSLVDLTRQAWLDRTRDTTVEEFIAEYQGLSVKVMQAEKKAADSFEARMGRPTKAARMTKEFKTSQAAKDLEKMLVTWLPKLNSGSPWRFTERDPLPSLYDESLIVAKKYSRKWRHLPASLHTEFGFNLEWEGFLLNGYIDAIDPLLTEDGELQGYLITDYKTYRTAPAGAKDWRQGVMYDIAFTTLCNEGVLPFNPELPRFVVYDYVRLLKRRDYLISEADKRMLLSDLTMYRDAVDAGVFLPAHKNTNPDFCDYPETCCMKTRGEGMGCRGSIYPEAEDGEVA